MEASNLALLPLESFRCMCRRRSGFRDMEVSLNPAQVIRRSRCGSSELRRSDRTRDPDAHKRGRKNGAGGDCKRPGGQRKVQSHQS